MKECSINERTCGLRQTCLWRCSDMPKMKSNNQKKDHWHVEQIPKDYERDSSPNEITRMEGLGSRSEVYNGFVLPLDTFYRFMID